MAKSKELGRIPIEIEAECMGCRKQMLRKGDRLGLFGTLFKCPSCDRMVILTAVNPPASE